jgi:hypothetical protein
MKTVLKKEGTRFLINDELVYAEIAGNDPKCHGLLMNARFVQGIFDDKSDAKRFNRFARSFDPDTNTAELIASLPQWYENGLRAITVGFQGGGPCYTIDNYSLENNPFSSDGTSLDQAYADRMLKIIKACDELGMVVVVSIFYAAMTRFLGDDNAILAATKTAANFLRDCGYKNLILEIANEHDISGFKIHPILYTPEGVCTLLDVARRESGNLMVGCSGTGGYFNEKIAQASDVIILHANNQSRGKFYAMIEKAKAIKPERPILFNEDSQCVGQIPVAVRHSVSWGYYNNLTKQEPPVDWGITKGEDEFFALRMALSVGLKPQLPKEEDCFYLAGLEDDLFYGNMRWIRLASLFPEQIDHVKFLRNHEEFSYSYDEPFMVYPFGNWRQRPVLDIQSGEEWEAVITLRDGRTINKKARVK